MHTLSIALAAAALVVLTQGARAEDCTKRPSQAEQIECLQRTVEVLQQQVQLLHARQSTFFLDGSRLGKRSIEELIDEKIRRALQPRLH